MEVARSLLRCFGLENKEEEYIELVEDRPFNDFRYAIDGSKLRQLGWSVKTYWEEGLAKTGASHNYIWRKSKKSFV